MGKRGGYRGTDSTNRPEGEDTFIRRNTGPRTNEEGEQSTYRGRGRGTRGRGGRGGYVPRGRGGFEKGGYRVDYQSNGENDKDEVESNDSTVDLTKEELELMKTKVNEFKDKLSGVVTADAIARKCI